MSLLANRQLLLALPATLLIMLAAEWLVPASLGDVAALPAARVAGTHSVSLPPRATSLWAADILARPLFSISRRPPKASSSGSAMAAPGDARLSGILVSSTVARAIFAPEAGGKPLVLNEGASVNDSVISRILPDRVILANGAVLRPSYDHNRAVPPPVLPQPALPFQNPAFMPGQQTGNEDGQQVQPALPQPPNPFRGPMIPQRRDQ